MSTLCCFSQPLSCLPFHPGSSLALGSASLLRSLTWTSLPWVVSAVCCARSLKVIFFVSFRSLSGSFHYNPLGMKDLLCTIFSAKVALANRLILEKARTIPRNPSFSTFLLCDPDSRHSLFPWGVWKPHPIFVVYSGQV